MPAKTKVCERCHEEKPLTDFIPRKLEHAWCKDCRSEDPRGAKLLQDRRMQRLKTPEENKAKHQAYKERYPERLKWRSEQDLCRTASQLAIQAMEQAKEQAATLKEQGYTRGQIKEIVEFLDGWEKIFKPE